MEISLQCDSTEKKFYLEMNVLIIQNESLILGSHKIHFPFLRRKKCECKMRIKRLESSLRIVQRTQCLIFLKEIGGTNIFNLLTVFFCCKYRLEILCY